MLNHIALLVPSVTHAAANLSPHGFVTGPVEEWPKDGTREIYVGSAAQSAKMLLVEPAGPGSYQRALAKRGPGLHHLAIDVPDVEAYVIGLSGSGWYLLPSSLASIKSSKTAWMTRPGIATLIEIHGRDDLQDGSPFISGVELPLDAKGRDMMLALGLHQITASPDEGTWLRIGRLRLPFSALC